MPGTGPSSGRGLVRALALAFLWPLRRFFDPRFVRLGHMVNHVGTRVEEVDGRVGAVQRGLESSDAEIRRRLGEEIGPLVEGAVASLDALGERVAALEALVGRLLSEDADRQAGRLVGGPAAELRGGFAELIDYAESAEGYRAQAGLPAFPGVRVRVREGEVALEGVDPLLAAVPFAHAALADLAAEAEVLDLSPPEAVLSPTLRALGHRPHRIAPLRGPLGEGVALEAGTLLTDGAPEPRFDAAVALGDLGALGVPGLPGEAPAAAALRALRGLVRKGGRLVTLEPADAPAPAAGGWRTERELVVAPEAGGWRPGPAGPGAVRLVVRTAAPVGDPAEAERVGEEVVQ
jgi:hypothetical protein